MTSNVLPPAFDTALSPMDQLIELSHHFGSDVRFVIAGGGNTSLKTAERLYVKGSGTSLAAINAGEFVEMDRAKLDRLSGQDLGLAPLEREERFKQAILAARTEPEKGQRPSVECVLHNLLPSRFVVHTHSTLVNSLACSVEGKETALKIFGEEILWIDYVDPGYLLARTLVRALSEYGARTGTACPQAVVMQNHGLIVCGDTAESILARTAWILNRIESHAGDLPLAESFGPGRRSEPAAARALIDTMGPVLRALLAEGDSLKIVSFDDSETALNLTCGIHGKAAALGGPLTPDQIVYCNSFPLWVDRRESESADELIIRLREHIRQHRAQNGCLPAVILVEGLGLFAVGDDYAQADTVRMMYLDAIRVMAGARSMGGIRALSRSSLEFIEHWEVESYRRKVALAGRRAGKASGLVAAVTGAAQGFGAEIAQDLASEGAHVALLDLNAEGATQQAETLVARCGAGRAKALHVDVTNGTSLADAFHALVRAYGGFDLLISNAGVLRAGSVKSQPEREFDLVTAVNYKGYFLAVQHAAGILALQHKALPRYWSDIIQINSKSGLAGSNRNGAYSGSKFGGIGLTQSFALELIEDGIKVNAICPGNYFDGPLWSDPQSGLFVQYLRTGKVPGAKTIEDVRRFYEAKVPMGRGCTTADVMRAVYYLISQKYETGQALPVTGGQIMLN